MIGTSWGEYAFIRVSILAIRAILPLSASYIASRVFGGLQRPYTVLDWYTSAEILFFLGVYLPFKRISQRPAEHPELLPRQKREILFRQCFADIEDLPNYLRKWFKDAPESQIKRENVREYLSWAFFSTNDAGDQHEDEVNGYIAEIEATRGRPFDAGKGRAVCLRLTLDEVRMIHRPMLWYIIILAIDMINHMQFVLNGYTFYRPSAIGTALLNTFPPRPQLLLASSRSVSRQVSYFYHHHTSKTHLPILFLHGIGIGPLTYAPYLKALNANRPLDDQIGVLVVELLPISFRLTPLPLGGSALSAEISQILDSHGISSCLLLAHSYGTAIAPHLLKHPLTSATIAGCVLIDPVSIMLHQPAVAYNFVHRQPTTANEWQLHYFASTDPGVSRTLSRSFFWTDNILWEQDWAPRPLTVVLGAKDLIVDTRCVAGYLSRGAYRGGSGQSAVEHWQRDDGLVRVLWGEDLDHAQVFDVAPNRAALVAETLRAARAGWREGAVTIKSDKHKSKQRDE